MRVRLEGDNAGFLARHWLQTGMLCDWDGERTAELLPIPVEHGVAFHRCYCAQLKSDAKGVGVVIWWLDGERF